MKWLTFDDEGTIRHGYADGEEIVAMRGPQAFEPRNVSLEAGLLHQALIAGSDRLGHGKLVGLALTQIFQPG